VKCPACGKPVTVELEEAGRLASTSYQVNIECTLDECGWHGHIEVYAKW